MTKKDYEAIALVIASQEYDDRQCYHISKLANDFADTLEKDNPKFDRKKFCVACGVNIF